MSLIWTKKRGGVHAALLSKAEETTGARISTLANLETRSEEVQALEANRTLLAEHLEWPSLRLSMARQVHGTHVAFTDKPEIIDNTDALVTNRVNLAIGVLVADCAAVLIADPVYRIVAAVHAGWRGAAGNIVEKGVATMIRAGAEPDVMQAYISPCISVANFEVGEEVAEKFPQRFVDYTGVKPHVDLKGFLRQELMDTGIPDDRIQVDGRCTLQEAETLHSYRRDGNDSGRMLAVIALGDS
ncbi:peptidoglycan editing factor PgeF [Balneolales bacterium ANBcel1]|nr:peptidoglycan editing factor PgeF [Balneolales bacterium ANBcel1]